MVKTPPRIWNECPLCRGMGIRFINSGMGGRVGACACESQGLQVSRRYRKRPVMVEAMLNDGTLAAADAIYDWANPSGDAASAPITRDHPDSPRVEDESDADNRWYLTIYTPEGTMKASPGDWVIKGVQGEFYPCKPGIFEATYDLDEEGDE